ncbi:PDZ domain-containing protein [Streptomyces indicus]|uniref:PDZ domain-containing protein n=1 Tax=Streptomyces indicus TaxID=417292 RepID=A0A1G8V8R3_9ACTN|nr:PDZ domain-containing protein [Streptomyces indicus]SDJ62359.1 PDZ domain-containing protein [Streptomyces indicus]
MEQTVLRPKPMPGRAPAPGHRPHAVRRRARRIKTVLGATVIALVLVLAGVGLGTVGATVIGMSKLADLQKQAAAQGGGQGAGQGAGEGAGQGAAHGAPPGAAKGGPPPSKPQPQGGEGESVAPAPATIGVEAVDPASGAGARLVGVHQPGPGFSAGLVRGDVVTSFAGRKVASAQELARAVAAARPGKSVEIGVRHENGNRQTLTVTPGVVT